MYHLRIERMMNDGESSIASRYHALSSPISVGAWCLVDLDLRVLGPFDAGAPTHVGQGTSDMADRCWPIKGARNRKKM